MTQLYLQRQTNSKLYMICRLAPFSMTLNDRRPLPPISRSHHYLILNISETVQRRHSFNAILIRTYTRPTQACQN